jgi:hypothetical protein
MTTLGNNLQSKLSTEALLALVKQKLTAWELQFCIQTGQEPGKADAYANEKMGEHVIQQCWFSDSAARWSKQALSIGREQPYVALCFIAYQFLCYLLSIMHIIVLQTRVWYLVQRLCIASMHS